MDTSVPRQRDASDAALVDMLTLEAPVGLALFGPDLRFRWVNAALARLGEDAEAVALSPAEVVPLSPEVPAVPAVPAVQKPPADPSACHGLLPSQAWPAPVASRAEAALRKVLDEGAPLTENGYPAVSVSPGPASGSESAAPSAEDVSGCASWFPVHDAAGHVHGVGLILLNVAGPSAEAAAAAAAAAAEIRLSEERYRSLVQGGAQVVWVAAPDGSMKEDSPEWRWITGQTQEQYAGFGWLAAVHPEDRERVDRDWRECVRSGKIFDDRYRIRTKNGSYRHYDVRAVPIERDGKIAEWVGASSDVTSQREAEEMRGRLTEQLSAAALRTARLQQATSMLAEALTVEQVVEVITEVGRSAIGADRSAVALLDPDRLRVRTINPTGLPDGPGAPAGDIPLDVPSVITMAINTRRPLLLENSDALRRVFDGLANVELFLTHTDERAWVGMPLLAAGAALGALRFSFTRPRKITDEERVFLEALAGQCALAVERASMFEREHTTAETLQRSLLPDQLPSVPGIILDARYLPVTRNMEIGGDWYDAFRLPDGRLAVAAGDVMGKGLSAAAGMGRVRNALRALALTDPRPAAVLAGLDRLFNATELDEQVTTVAYLVFDPVSGEGLAGNAGHPPPLLMSRDAPPRLDLGEAGTPLGWASPRQQYVFRLPPGNTAVLYSDGLVENRRRGLDAGLDELVAVAAQVSPGVADDPARLLSFLVDRMLTGYEQDDDVTVLVLHVPRRDGGASAGEGDITNGAGRSR
jgi:PAS domain S-box-containing protein